MNNLFDDESVPMITPSEVIEHLFCSRFTYFMNCLQISQHEENRFKVLKGRELHLEKEIRNRNYLRKKLGCIDREVSVYLASKKLRVRGIVDEVLILNDGTLSPLDYKYAEYSEHSFSTLRIQSVLYALLIMENYNKPVKKGFICYTRSKNKIKEILYTEKDFVYAKKVIVEIFDIIQKGYFPPKGKHSLYKCIDCCYRNICIK